MKSKLVWVVLGTACGSHPAPALGVDAGSGSAQNFCKVSDADGGDAIPACVDHAPPNSFDPDIQWTWNGGTSGETNSYVTPLVANLTDDNGDGAIDLCDIPDVVVVSTAMTNGFPHTPGHIHLLDGAHGTEELMIPTAVDATVTPALGDLDGDGVPEIVTVDAATGALYAFHHDGTILFGPSAVPWVGAYTGAIALADLDHDGHVEILCGTSVYDDRGALKWKAAEAQSDYAVSIAADLDGDGFMEVITGPAAYRYDGTLYWKTTLLGGFAQVANFDADPAPEVLLTNADGLSLIKYDGTVVFHDKRPTGEAPGSNAWLRPAAVGDFNGDGVTDFAMSSGPRYDVYSPTAVSEWDAMVADPSGAAAGTAFDFLGDGHTEAMYADETNMWVFDDRGHAIFKLPRSSETLIEYPVVADVDNDGSAEIVVTSNVEGPASPTVQVIRDKQDRWIQARRIWNQHSYHVTNVREDGTIPRVEPDSWKQLNTYRVNAQISSTGVCVPTLL